MRTVSTKMARRVDHHYDGFRSFVTTGTAARRDTTIAEEDAAPAPEETAAEIAAAPEHTACPAFSGAEVWGAHCTPKSF